MNIDCRLAVDRGHVQYAVKAFAKLVRKVKPAERAEIGFDGVCMTLEARDMRFMARATGEWPGTAIVSAALVHALAAALPPDDPIIVSCHGTELRFGPLKLACKWEPISAVALSRTRAWPEWIEGIMLKYILPRARIAAAGRLDEVRFAEKRLEALIRRVARSLGPLGVTVDDVTTLVERRLAERHSTDAE